jgi:hypothetical protein
LRGEAPIASHLLGVLRGNVAGEREQGIAAGLAWGPVAEARVVYLDRAITAGMARGIANAESAGRPIEDRLLEESTP